MTIDLQQLLTLIAIICGPGGLLIAVLTRRKTKADALAIIQAAAANQVTRLEEEAEKWKVECHGLRDELEEIKGKVDEQDACQTTLKRQVEDLEREKKTLLEEVGKLRKRVEDLEQENRRLKCEVNKAEV
jgi:predicted  nucleic acid-binding Zn-ribbon protein